MENIIDKSSYNALTKTRFIFDLDLSFLTNGKYNLKNFSLNCGRVDTPDIVCGVTYVAHQGYQIPIPNGNREEEKLLEIEFTVSENLIQYAIMLKWMNLVAPQLEKVPTPTPNHITTANLWALDSYLKPNASPIHYEGLFIHRLGRLQFDHSDEGEIMKCTASFAYFNSDIDIDKIIVQA